MPDTLHEETWEQLHTLLLEDDLPAMQELLERLSSAEVSLAISRISDNDRNRLLGLLPPDFAAHLIEQLPDVQAIEIIENLGAENAAAILDELPSSEQADLLGHLDVADADAILQQMDPQEAAAAILLSNYDDDVAGGLMVTEYLQFPKSFTVDQVVRELRLNSDEYRDYDVQYAYVTDDKQKLVGVLRMRDLLLARGNAAISTLMIPKPLVVGDQTTLEELVDFFDSHSFLGVPVVNSTGKMLGVVQKSAVDEATADKRDSDYLKSQGIVGGEEIRSLPTLLRAKRRLSWLSVNILLNIMAASVIAIFQDTLSAVIALAVFLPIISDMSGCSGSQAVAVTLRELSLGLIRPSELLRVWLKEISVGMINGVALGVLIGLVAILWKGNPYLGLVVGSALALNTMVAVSVGGLIPLVLKKFHVDPAIAAGPILTTVTDMCGFFFVLGFASIMLDRLT